MKIGVVTVVYSGYPYILFDSIKGNTSHDISWHVHSHTSDPVLESYLAWFCVGNTVNLSFHRANRGLSRSWNDGILASYAEQCDYTLVINDDIGFIPGGFDRFIDFLAQQGDFGLGFLNGRETASSPYAGTIMDQGFGCFAFGPRAYREIGAFDENFFPAYSEDIDYVTRVRSAGIPNVLDTSVLAEHARNHTTNTTANLRATMSAFKQENSRYFAQKWGGDEQSPVYKRPWNRLPLHIEWKQRHNPYGPDFDRPELAHTEGERPNLRSGICPSDLAITELKDRNNVASHIMVRTAFKSLLGREPEASAVSRYGDLLQSGSYNLDDLISTIRSSEEFGIYMSRGR